MKLTALFTSLVLALTLTACAPDSPNSGTSVQQPENNSPSQSQVQTPTEKPAPSQTETPLTRDEAITIALRAAGLDRSTVRDLDTELDLERGTAVWEIDFEAGTQEYSYVLDAQTGNILHQNTERD